jgi:hypothetical protein
MSELIPIDCAVNDDHGCTSDRVAAIHFPGLELDTVDMRGPRFREGMMHGEFRIKVGRREWGVRHLASCVGNIYWERYGMNPCHAAAFLHYLRSTKWFTPDGGLEELWKWWESGINAENHVQKLLIDAAKDDRL